MFERQYWLGFSLVSGVGAVRVRRLLEMFGSLKEAWHASLDDLAHCGLDRRALQNFSETRRKVDLPSEMARLDKLGIALLTWEDEDYPPLLTELRAIDHAPPVLYMRGSVDKRDHWSVAVVGTRTASAYGKQVTHRLANELAANGITIVSGLARGIDTEAHLAALEAGGRTIAVLPCGMDTVYPPENRILAAKIIQNGAVMTSFPLGTQAEAKNFAPRNRIMSGLSRGVLVAEAGDKSGALMTTGYTLEQGREVFAVPGNITAKGSSGTNRLIRDGAVPVMTAQDVLEALNLKQVVNYADAQANLPEMSEVERQLLKVFTGEAIHVDVLARESGLPVSTVNSTLTMLELKGVIRQVAAMTYTRN